MDFLATLQTSPPIFGLAVFFLGLCIGSFLNVVIHRLPKMLEREWRSQCLEYLGQTAEPGQDDVVQAPPAPFNLAYPGSSCPACGHSITPLENIPVASYLFLKGKCSACGVKISPRYPAVELFTALLSGFVAWHFGWGWTALVALLFTWSLIALAFIDADTQLLPDDVTFPLLWLGLLVNLVGTFTTLSSSVIGAVAGYMSLWSVYWGFKLLTGKEGMGYGDFKLLSALGAWLGWQLLPLIILLSAAAGAVVGLVGMVVLGRERGSRIPFGPYLAAAGFMALIWGQQLNAWYLGRMP